MIVPVAFFLYLARFGSIGSMGEEWVDPALSSRGSSDWVDPSPPPPASVHDSAGGGDDLPYVHEHPCYDLNFSHVDAAEWTGPAPSTTYSIDEASEHMAAHLIEKYNSGKWFATDICKLHIGVK